MEPTPKTDALDATLLVTMTAGQLRELIRVEIQAARTAQQEADRLLDAKEAAKVLSMSEDCYIATLRSYPSHGS
jgi:hypothetical protein